jgi:hypothetical protein
MPQDSQASIRLHASRGHALRDVAIVALSLLAIAAFLASAIQP